VGSFFRRRDKEPGAFCPVCSQLELFSGGRIPHWKCRGCGTKIPERTYFAFMTQALGSGPRAVPAPLTEPRARRRESPG